MPDNSQYMIKLKIPAETTTTKSDYDTHQILFDPIMQKNQHLTTNNTHYQIQNHSQNELNDFKTDEAVYKFDKLKKELSTSVNNNNAKNDNPASKTMPNQIRFSCNNNSQDEEDEENSNIISIPNGNTYMNTNNNNQLVQNHAHMTIPSTSLVKTQNLNTEMDWNDSDIFQLCQELDDQDTFFNRPSSMPNQNQQIAKSNTISSIKNELNFFTNTNTSQSQMYLQNQNFNMTQQTNQTFNFNFDLTDDSQNQPQPFVYSQHFLNEANTFSAKTAINSDQSPIYRNLLFNTAPNAASSLSSGGGNSALFLDNNNSDATASSSSNVLIPWEFENDFNQITSYLQSPTI